jgi:hypothetical protein
MTPDSPTGPPNEHGCVCLAPGYCQKLGRDMTKWNGLLYQQCRNVAGYCEAMTADGTREGRPKPKAEPEAKPEMPSLKRRAAGLAKTVAATAAAPFRGQPVTATAEQAAEREAICRACDNLVTKPDGTTWCGKIDGCGCLISAKIWVAQTKCPKGKWPPINGEPIPGSTSPGPTT